MAENNESRRPIFPYQVEEIVTSRLILRPMCDEDIKYFHDIRTKPEVMKWTHKRKIDTDMQETKSWMEKFLQPDLSDPPFHLSIIEKTTGHIIGMVGVYTLRPQAELGYMLHPDKWGVGYATEALTAFLQKWWELPRYNQDKASNIEESLFADAHKENRVSLRLMEKIGFKRYTEFVEDGDEIIGLKLRRPSLCNEFL